MAAADAAAATQPQETVGLNAAFEERVKLDLQELRQISAAGRLLLGDEGRGMLLNRAYSVFCSGR